MCSYNIEKGLEKKQYLMLYKSVEKRVKVILCTKYTD